MVFEWVKVDFFIIVLLLQQSDTIIHVFEGVSMAELKNDTISSIFDVFQTMNSRHEKITESVFVTDIRIGGRIAGDPTILR